MIAVAATVWHLWHERNQSLFQTKKTTKFTILENIRRLDQRSGALFVGQYIKHAALHFLWYWGGVPSKKPQMKTFVSLTGRGLPRL